MDKKIDDLLKWDEFLKVDMRVGTILEAEVFEEARKPAFKMLIDFGACGQKKTSAQITKRYKLNDLIGRQIVAVINFPPKQIANIMSECLVLGVLEDEGDVTLLQPQGTVSNGSKIG